MRSNMHCITNTTFYEYKSSAKPSKLQCTRKPTTSVRLVPVLLEIFLKLLRLLVSDLNRTNIIIRLFQPDRTIAYVLA